MIAAGWADLGWYLAILKVALGLGFVIFVHELGHFVVAKLAGVKCEKFYLGFDIAGLKLAKFTYGETEYGIGILPLGGYVKMLGQEDNPAQMREEIERARLAQQAEASRTHAPQAEAASEAKADESEQGEAAAATSSEQATENKNEPDTAAPTDEQAAEAIGYDPRSYLAKSVPKRMAIISAGVIMNLIFAFLMAVVAYGLGVKRIDCGVGQLIAGEAAWQAGLQVGDKIVSIGGQKCEKFRDLQEAISLGEIDNGIAVTVRRPGVAEPLTFHVHPDRQGLLPRIGVTNPRTTTLSKDAPAVMPGSAADKAEPPFEPGDTIVAADDLPIESYRQLHAYLAMHPGKPLSVTVRRSPEAADSDADEASQTETVTTEVPVRPMRRLGLVMEMGEVTAVQAGSPAEQANVQPGDLLTQIDGQPVGDPMTLAARLRRRAGETVVLTVEREGATEPLEMPVTLRQAEWYEQPLAKGDPMSAPALGIAYRVLRRVHATLDDSPAAAEGLRPGDLITSARFIPPPAGEDEPEALAMQQREVTLPFGKDESNWPVLISMLQQTLPGTRVELTWTRQDEPHTATLATYADVDWPNPDRGFLFEPAYFYQEAGSLGEAIRLGGEETINATLLVYRFLQKLGTQVSPKALGGPVSIFIVAQRAAEQSTAELLIFLTVLSANLAVINFLPIPLLDGGHMVLLAWEGIRGKPADERIQILLTYIGLIFILGLMLWVIGLDIQRLVSG